MDFKFTGTRDEENAKDVKDALCISLVMVDQESKFVHAIPVPSKEVMSYLVEEVCCVLMLMEKNSSCELIPSLQCCPLETKSS